ncbi:hypothetical protein EF847_03040 [Actinobacteria bacterium YIM 96077]|uniref:Uncharacterized protein n=1 Tax=Phytoactinopolyspora halophila TaxID=1981511 RepID=A0A329R658_9ACTN|nr:hypothetical protein [Phytoactinopolyspora halophila]AYY11846.1 hypothetical protein EF847_03040 [Actinobacteria bacterium YIM 96077]RAW18922.1 hypothetical protein DPM12_02465 [Phytoactinopolyspora halophila]
MRIYRAPRPDADLEWLSSRPEHEAATGYDAQGWESSTWILHAMYHNPAFDDLGTYDELHQRELRSGTATPLIVGGLDLDEITTVTGAPLGFAARPGESWRRLPWHDYFTAVNVEPDRQYPPCFRWFPHRTWPVSIAPPPEGSLDGESLETLVESLAGHSPQGARTECIFLYASLPAGDFENPHVWRGPLGATGDLLEHHGGPYSFTPTNIWPHDRSWFVWTDYDLSGTKVSGSRHLIQTLDAAPALETWSDPR